MTLKVHSPKNHLTGIDYTENAYSQFPCLANTPLPKIPEGKLTLIVDGLDKELFLDRGRDGTVLIKYDEIDQLIEKLLLAKKLVGS